MAWCGQGWGNLVNTAVLCILLVIFGQTTSNYNNHSLDAVWRISFGLGLIPITGMLLYRLFFLQESKVWKKQHKPAQVRLDPSPVSLRLSPFFGELRKPRNPNAGTVVKRGNTPLKLESPNVDALAVPVTVRC